MKNQRKESAVIINKFPKILYMLTLWLRDENVDYILDASRFSDPVSLFRAANPGHVMLNVGLPAKQAIELTSRNLKEDVEINKAMITSSSKAYYISLCNSFCSSYVIDKSVDMESIPGMLAKQQAN